MAKKKAKTSSLGKTTNVKTYQLMIFLILFAFVGAYSLMQTFAAPADKGGGKNSGTSSLTYSIVVDVNGDGLPNWGDTLRFNPVTTATAAPYVELTCNQNGVLVYAANAGYFEGYLWPWTQDMKLGSNMWTGGDADCSAKLYMLTAKGKTGTSTLATIAFKAGS